MSNVSPNEQSPHDLNGRIALVTGGSRGIGRAIAIELAKRGADVVINYAGNEAAAKASAELVKAAGGKDPLVLKFDVSDADAVNAGIAKIKDHFGGLHILVNNAGVSHDGLLMRFKDEDWAQTMATNLSGAFYCARAASKLMMKARWGRIINISSIVGESGNAGQVAYTSAKAGMIGLTKSLAKELASRNITTNAVAPGYIETDMTKSLPEAAIEAMMSSIPLKSAGQPEDVANAVGFLASDAGRYITGHVLSVNGGMYM